MKRYWAIRSMLLLVLCGCLSASCKKRETYDLFPLKVGNEFYYRYYKYRFSGVSSYINGTESSKVVSQSSQGSYINYTIELKMNAVVTGIGAKIISDSIRYVEIKEDKSSMAGL